MQEIYSSEQIRIPPELPEILKNYAKFIIKNHPGDIFQASLEYFRNLANQGKLNEGKLTDAQLSRFYRKFNVDTLDVTREQIEEACLLAEISDSQQRDTLSLGNWVTDSIPWIPFFAFLVASAAGSLKATILKVIKVSQADGSVPASMVETAYAFLTTQDKSVKAGTDAKIKEMLLSKKGGMIKADEALQKIEEYFNLSEDVVTVPDTKKAETAEKAAPAENESGLADINKSTSEDVEMKVDEVIQPSSDFQESKADQLPSHGNAMEAVQGQEKSVEPVVQETDTKKDMDVEVAVEEPQKLEPIAQAEESNKNGEIVVEEPAPVEAAKEADVEIISDEAAKDIETTKDVDISIEEPSKDNEPVATNVDVEIVPDEPAKNVDVEIVPDEPAKNVDVEIVPDEPVKNVDVEIVPDESVQDVEMAPVSVQEVGEPADAVLESVSGGEMDLEEPEKASDEQINQ